MKRPPLSFFGIAFSTMLFAPSAHAGSFDPQGNWLLDPQAAFSESFETMPSWDLDNPEPGAVENLYVMNDDEALHGQRSGFVRVSNWWEGVSLPVSLPSSPGSYRAKLWVRSGDLSAVFVGFYNTKASGQVVADLSATGRCTSDGWVELTSAPFSLDGAHVEASFLYLRGSGMIDAIEIERVGPYRLETTCKGAFDPVCEGIGPCITGYCRDGNSLVPHLPAAANRNRVVDLLQSRIQYFFGGHKTRRDHLPEALQEIEKMRIASSAWAFWNGYATAIRKLHDWHTAASGLINTFRSNRQLDVCFIEGKADLSHAQQPAHDRYLDILVSHTGENKTSGLKPGDRLVAVDGLHPIEWARTLVGTSWDWWQASDERVNAEFAELMRGLIPKYARTFSILRCHASSNQCEQSPEVIEVDSLSLISEEDGPLISCDNRPAYHLVEGPDPKTHQVGYEVFAGLLKDSGPGENLYGMTWDTLWGPAFSSVFRANNETFKKSARGVILDHRAGNGGTIDAPEAITELVRTPLDIAIFIYQRPWADYEGPHTPEEGITIFDRYKTNTAGVDLTYTVGSNKAKLDLPVALLLHRDGSASDYLPFGMKGAPSVRIFGPQPTAGAFSSYLEFSPAGSLSIQMASGDTIAFDGSALIGNGVEPDEIVVPLQSDLIHGKDTIYLRALEWIRSELEP